MKIPYKEIFDTIDYSKEVAKKAADGGLLVLQVGLVIILLPVLFPFRERIKDAVLRKISGTGW